MLFIVSIIAACTTLALGDGEYIGQFENKLVTNAESIDDTVFKHAPAERFKGKLTIADDAHVASARLIDPRTQSAAILAALIEEPGQEPVVYVDANGDNSLSDDEKIPLKREEEGNRYRWIVSAEIRLENGPFKTMPIFLRYYKNTKYSKMGPEDRLFEQSTDVMVRAHVNINGKDVLLQYAYDVNKKKVDPFNGWLGVDTDGNGEVDIHDLSPESTKADDETVVFRVGDIYISTKKADLAKNQVIVKQNNASDYKRAELLTGKEFPQFSFTDLDGKKRSFNEFRGKYVLLDIWGIWCPACREEVPYIREASNRFQSRNFVVLGLNTDENYTLDSIKAMLIKNNMNWTNAQLKSVSGFLSTNLRIHSFPATFLIGPDGKIISMNRTEKDEPGLRGQALLKTLATALPEVK